MPVFEDEMGSTSDQLFFVTSCKSIKINARIRNSATEYFELHEKFGALLFLILGLPPLSLSHIFYHRQRL